MKVDTVSSPQLTVKAPAKINLFLRVVGRRPDGYHEIESFMQKVELSDELHLFAVGEKISLACPNSSLPEDEGNLVFRAAQLFFKTVGKQPGVRIVLEKNIPVAAGLGGGSSDAAATLLGLNELWSLGLSRNELGSLAEQLGSDVPFCLIGGTCFVAGKGEIIERIDMPDMDVLLVSPGYEMSTKEAYEKADNVGYEKKFSSLKMKGLKDVKSVANGLYNDFIHI